MISQQDIPQTAELFTANLGSWRDASDPDKGASFYSETTLVAYRINLADLPLQLSATSTKTS